MVERSLSMREVPGSIPGASIPHFKLILDSYILSIKVGSIFTHKLLKSRNLSNKYIYRYQGITQPQNREPWICQLQSPQRDANSDPSEPPLYLHDLPSIQTTELLMQTLYCTKIYIYKVFLLLVAISCQIGSRENLYVQIDPQTKMSKYRQ